MPLRRRHPYQNLVTELVERERAADEDQRQNGDQGKEAAGAHGRAP